MKIVKMDGINLTVYFSDMTSQTFKTAEDYKDFLRSYKVETPQKKKRGKK